MVFWNFLSFLAVLAFTFLAEAKEITIGSWSESVRREVYHRSTGGRILPVDWFQALEVPDETEKISTSRVLHEEFGFVLDPKDAKGFPVGVTETQIQEDYSTAFDLHGQFIGLNCVGCHTGELHYKGNTLYIDGGSGRVNIEKFIDYLTRSTSQTGTSVSKFYRFAGEATTGQPLLFQYVNGYAYAFQSISPRAGTTEGPGRSDTISKGVSAFAIYNENNRQTIDAPVSIPALWNTHRYDYRHYSGSNRQALGRDVSATVGGGAGVDLRLGSSQFNSSMDIESIHWFENRMAELKAPTWPQTYLGILDLEKAEHGKDLYVQNCAKCHDGTPNGNELKLTMVPLDEIGTDPNAAKKFELQVKAEEIGFGTLPAYRIFEKLTSGVIDYQFKKLNFSPEKQKEYTEGRPNEWRGPMAYKAEPLNGIWATPPYLHNGSVPTLYDLLLPEDKRPKVFYMCVDTEYDAVRVGYVTNDDRENCTTIDTRITGNNKTGHNYGTTLDESDRSALVEYLKTL